MQRTSQDRQKIHAAFSLIEVVIATAVFATAIVAIIGLMAPLSRRVEDVIDSETAARLADSIRTELTRIGFSTTVSLTGAASEIHLVANEHGDRVRLATGASPAADNALNHASVPGIADRDRYFRITLTRAVTYDPVNSGSLALRADVVWPFQLPLGPASSTTTAHGAGADPFSEANAMTRQTLPFFFTVIP